MDQMFPAGMTFRDYFFKGLVTDPLWLIVLACVAGLVGMTAHWYKRMKIEKEGIPFMEWFVWNRAEATVIAMITMVAGVVGAILPLEIASVSLYQALVTGFTMGYAADSAFNRGTPKLPPEDTSGN